MSVVDSFETIKDGSDNVIAVKNIVPIHADGGVRLPFEDSTYEEEGAIRFNAPNDKIELYNGVEWVNASSGADVSGTPPTPAVSGDVWFDHTSGRSYIYYEDGDSGQWVEANPSWNGSIPTGGVSTDKIADSAVTPAKLDRAYIEDTTDVITSDLIQNDAVTNNKLSDSAVTNSKLADISISTSKLQLASVTPDILDREYVEPPVGGQVVGYQQGRWLPTVRSIQRDIVNGNTNIWAWEGVIESPTGPGGANPFILPDRFYSTWSRIGQQVTITNWTGFATSGGGAGEKFIFDNLPYTIRDPDADQIYYVGSGHVVAQAVTFPANTYNINPYYWTGQGGGQFIGFRFTYLNTSSTGVDMTCEQINSTTYLKWETTYETDDTTWTPINGATVQ